MVNIPAKVESWAKSPWSNIVVRGERRSESKRREILSAARALFITVGYADTGMEVVARQAGVSTATLYAHFPSKADLFQTTVDDLIADLAEDLKSVETRAKDARARLASFADGYARFCNNPDTRAVLRMVCAERHKFAEAAETLRRRTRSEIGNALIEMIAELAERGDLEVDRPSWAASQLLGLIEHSTLLYGLVNGDGEQVERPAGIVADEAVATFLARYGVRGRGG